MNYFKIVNDRFKVINNHSKTIKNNNCKIIIGHYNVISDHFNTQKCVYGQSNKDGLTVRPSHLKISVKVIIIFGIMWIVTYILINQ